MKESRLNQLCNLNGLRNYDLFVKWFTLCFPNESHESYIIEWIGRFKSGDPTTYMDTQRLNAYIGLIAVKKVIKE